MYANILVLALAASQVAAHGKIAVVTGDAGGNGTGMGIQGAVIPGAGKNSVTEPDTTVFKGDQADSCGRTKGAGDNDIEAGTKQAMVMSGDTLPQISAEGGSVSGTIHVVTSDGFGPYQAMINTDGTGQTWQKMEVTTQVPGNNGNGKKTQRSLLERAMNFVGIQKRATNINEDYPIAAAVPAGTKCTGTVAGQANTCIVKMVNPSKAGPFGGCVTVQQAAPGAAPAPGSAAARRMAALKA